MRWFELFAAVLLLPVFVLAEELIRGERCIWWLGDILCEVLAWICLLPAILFIFEPGLLFVPVVAAILLSLVRQRLGNIDSGAKALIRSSVLVTIVVLVGVLYIWMAAFWFFLCDWQTSLAAGLGVGLCLLYFLLVRRLRFAGLYWAAIGLLPLPLFFGVNIAQYFMARPVPVDLINEGVSYDAAFGSDGSMLLTSKTLDRAVHIVEDLKKIVPNTNHPQRIAADDLTGDFYIANSGESAVTRWDGERSNIINLPGCRQALDIEIDVARRRIYASCWASGTVHRYGISDGSLRTARLHRKIYGICLDTESQVLYATGDFFAHSMAALDVRDMKLKRSGLLGIVNWGMALDQSTGDVWMARGMAGDLLRLDSEFNVLDRVKVGGGARDVEIDAERRLLVVGNFFSGTVSVVDLDSAEVIDTLRPGRFIPFPRLRGVVFGPDGFIYAAYAAGVTRLDWKP